MGTTMVREHERLGHPVRAHTRHFHDGIAADFKGFPDELPIEIEIEMAARKAEERHRRECGPVIWWRSQHHIMTGALRGYFCDSCALTRNADHPDITEAREYTRLHGMPESRRIWDTDGLRMAAPAASPPEGRRTSCLALAQ